MSKVTRSGTGVAGTRLSSPDEAAQRQGAQVVKFVYKLDAAIRSRVRGS
jgi:hypothetical protein